MFLLTIHNSFIHPAIITAAMEMLGGEEVDKQCRKPEIMADAAYAIITKDSKSFTAHFAVDDEILKAEGVTDLDQYAIDPSEYSVLGSACQGVSHCAGVWPVYDADQAGFCLFLFAVEVLKDRLYFVHSSPLTLQQVLHR